MLFVIVTKRETLVLISWWIPNASPTSSLCILLHSLLALVSQFIVDQSIGKLRLTFSTVSMPVWWTLPTGRPASVALHGENYFLIKIWVKTKIYTKIKSENNRLDDLCVMSRWCNKSEKKTESGWTDFLILLSWGFSLWKAGAACLMQKYPWPWANYLSTLSHN